MFGHKFLAMTLTSVQAGGECAQFIFLVFFGGLSCASLFTVFSLILCFSVYVLFGFCSALHDPGAIFIFFSICTSVCAIKINRMAQQISHGKSFRFSSIFFSLSSLSSSSSSSLFACVRLNIEQTDGETLPWDRRKQRHIYFACSSICPPLYTTSSITNDGIKTTRICARPPNVRVLGGGGYVYIYVCVSSFVSVHSSPYEHG